MQKTNFYIQDVAGDGTLTSQKHEGSWYVKFEFLGKTEYAALCQARVMSVSRLYNKMGMLPESDLQKIREGFRSLY